MMRIFGGGVVVFSYFIFLLAQKAKEEISRPYFVFFHILHFSLSVLHELSERKAREWIKPSHSPSAGLVSIIMWKLLTPLCNRIKNKIMIACKCLGGRRRENLPSVFLLSAFSRNSTIKTKESMREESHVTNCEFPNDEYSARIDQKKREDYYSNAKSQPSSNPAKYYFSLVGKLQITTTTAATNGMTCLLFSQNYMYKD